MLLIILPWHPFRLLWLRPRNHLDPHRRYKLEPPSLPFETPRTCNARYTKTAKQGRNVAILVHEFPESGGSYGDGCSGGKSKVTITLNGEATIQVGRDQRQHDEGP